MTRCYLKQKLRKLEAELMNGRQAAKLAAKRIEEMERVAALNCADIVDYNKCILHMIAGGSPCEYCEDLEECQLQAKGGTGCGEWMLKMPKPKNGGEGADESKSVLPAGSESGT